MQIPVRVFLFLSVFMLNVSFAPSVDNIVVKKVDKGFTSSSILGIWVNADGAVKVKIERIGGKFYGKIIWLEQPFNAEGDIKRDKLNPDPALQSRPFIGLRVLKNLEYTGNGVYENGTIYDPESGKTYGCKINMQDANTANVRGYVLFTFIGKTETFKRVK